MSETETINKENKSPEPIKLILHRMDGSDTGKKIELDRRVFGLERNEHVLYLAVKAEMTNRRQGNSSSKGRSEVRGGGRKPFRQKGRGGARAGTNRSPIWRGGGITFGPQTKDYSMKLPRKVKRLARKIAYSVRAARDAIRLVEDIKLDQPKTKIIAGMLHNFDKEDMSVLILTDKSYPNIVKACCNIPRVEVRECLNASTWEILRARRLIITRPALDALVGGLADA